MQQAQAAAEERGITLNQTLLGPITDGVDQQRTRRESAARADVAAALAILDRAPDVRPEPDDEIR
ncbi:toxin-antitoxin system HicB family antitoxin [Methylobacterium nonmethylotrophicum]|uniref:Toxin-antitoxin system HicB family antitoxin n=1 Tax=Methylobacterium nonmethylotrophicum TaxID=1141884 RepID=A0A4Z0NWA9_9HYPH|nr:toxin-antitoxin system HicB family antitoxin [Methylobacterium nonmethylotrophicum]TGE01624.1 toxin-antitoxin system HicB family antitoxin [Methylobacterium nonmethylotrophicum]